MSSSSSAERRKRETLVSRFLFRGQSQDNRTVEKAASSTGPGFSGRKGSLELAASKPNQKKKRKTRRNLEDMTLKERWTHYTEATVGHISDYFFHGIPRGYSFRQKLSIRLSDSPAGNAWDLLQVTVSVLACILYVSLLLHVPLFPPYFVPPVFCQFWSSFLRLTVGFTSIATPPECYPSKVMETYDVCVECADGDTITGVFPLEIIRGEVWDRLPCADKNKTLKKEVGPGVFGLRADRSHRFELRFD